jgi:hypothetical protein
MDIFQQINPVVGASLIGAVAACISVFGVVRAKKIEVRESLLREHREKRIQQYEKMVNAMWDLFLWKQMKKKEPTADEVAKSIIEFGKTAVIWGSDDLIKHFVALRSGSDGDLTKTSESVTNLLIAIRRDLGHKNEGLDGDTLLRVMFNDVDKLKTHLREKSPNP